MIDPHAFAFPFGTDMSEDYCGMDIRTWLAGQALSACVDGPSVDLAASWAVRVADAVIEELNRVHQGRDAPKPAQAPQSGPTAARR